MLCFGTSIMSERFTINAGIGHCPGKTRPPNLNLAMEFAVQWNVTKKKKEGNGKGRESSPGCIT